jgi:Spy/CpxP family protein refolding chaperone
MKRSHLLPLGFSFLCCFSFFAIAAEESRPEHGGNRREGARREGAQRYSLEQACSDRAQLHTIAFSGLAFITGDFGASTFIPPGKVCDFFGFQYMRDIDAAEKGHNPMFLNRVAGNVLHILNDEQKKIFADLAAEQAPQLEALVRMRLPLIKAFCMELNGERPAGSTGLNKAAVQKCVGDIFERDAELSLRRAEVMAQVAASLTEKQKAYLAKMKFGDFNTWPEMDERDKLRRPREGDRRGERPRRGGRDGKEGGGPSKLFNVAYMTYASEFFSWTKGSVKADTYFCPERHGTYFGGFYMKDMPAMGKRDFDISTSVTGDSGRSFVEDVLTAGQSKHLNTIPDQQRKALAEIVITRRAISTELRTLLAGKTPDRKKILAMGRRYGELDGEVSWLYATAFARINRTLTTDQRKALMKLRNLDGYKSTPYYIYSRGAADQPVLKGVEALFAAPARKTPGASK